MLSPRLITILIILAVIGSLTASTWAEHEKYLVAKSEYAAYVSKAEALAANQRAKIAQLEKDNAERLHIAELARLAALDQLRHDQAIASARRVSVTPQAAGGTDRVCFARSKLDEAVQRFLADVQGFVAEGDNAIIGVRAALSEWPK